MKHLICLILTLIVAIGHASAAPSYRLSGHIVDKEKQAIAFATVILLHDGNQIAGTTSDAEGRFTLQAPAGAYTLSVQHLSYTHLQRELRIERNTDIAEVILQPTATQIKEVEVKAHLIRREADRFVVDVANSPSAIGRDGVELLKNSPGVWIQDDKISINGQSGTKVYINDRPLRMDDVQQAAYLRSLTAADIQKIEVIPSTGADYDADNSAGVIKITLKRRRDDGLTGNVGFRTKHSHYLETYNPSGSINYHSDRWSVNAAANGTWGPKSDNVSEESTRYHNTNSMMTAHSDFNGKNNHGGARLGAIFEANDHHSIGLEAEYNVDNEVSLIQTRTNLQQQQVLTRKESLFDQHVGNDRLAATFNYIWKFDTLGSTFKVLADYNSSLNTGHNDNFTQTQIAGMRADSTYRNSSQGDYRVVAVNAALEKNFTRKLTLRTGAKYTFNNMYNRALYEYEREGWQAMPDYSYDGSYNEHITALYAALSLRAGRWSAVAGVRAEYTHATGDDTYVQQDYLSLFPNANLTYSFTKDGAYSLTAQYSRNITRPSFWALNPMRRQVSDYTYMSGNPLLRPSFSHAVNLTLVMAYKYTVSAGMNIKTDDINQHMTTDPIDPNILSAQTINYANIEQYYVSAYLPLQITKWWTSNANLLFAYMGDRITPEAPQNFRPIYQAGLSTTFTLPAKFFIDIDYYYMGNMGVSSMEIGDIHLLNASLKKRFWGDRLTAVLSTSNILNQKQTVRSISPDFERQITLLTPWTAPLNFSITYNFKSGKAFRKRTIESGASEERGRLAK